MYYMYYVLCIIICLYIMYSMYYIICAALLLGFPALEAQGKPGSLHILKRKPFPACSFVPGPELLFLPASIAEVVGLQFGC